ncbi:MAG: hypothetical protein R6U32_01145 [Candidatus Woesearchaeota archaeon]
MRFRFQSIALTLIGINIVVFLLQIFLGSSFTQAFMLLSSDISSRP